MSWYHSIVKPQYTSSFAVGLRCVRAIVPTILLAAVVLSLSPPPLRAQALPSLGDTERGELSPLMERKLGEQIMRDIRSDPDYLDDAPLLEYMNGLGGQLVAARPEVRGEAQFDFFYFVVRDPTLNAFAMPGGFIGVNSALILATENESELAAVLAHETGHVAQRHIARKLGKQKEDMLIPLASMIVGALTLHASPDAGMAMIAGGEGLAVQRSLNFSRDEEREADRVGLGILYDAGFDTSAMASFFMRLQNGERNYTSPPPFLLTHPLTSERIADIQNRIRDQRYRQHADSLDFSLIQARVRVLQDTSHQGLLDAGAWFERQVRQQTRSAIVAGKYGLAFVALKKGDAAQAQSRINEARAALKNGAPTAKNAVLSGLEIDIKLAAHQAKEAVQEADAARNQFPLSRALAWQYGDTLFAAGRYADAVAYLRDQTQLYRKEPQLYDRLAKAYAAQGKQALQHLALAEFYALNGSLQAGLDQLSIARKSPDASFYDQSIIDAREREMRVLRKDELEQEKKG